jgi:pSer/pThr/pTyr-binding forkhead associated (FHA) protein
VGVFDRFFGQAREVRAARRAELRGELDKAAELYGLASAPEEAARVMLLRGDAETDIRVRMRHYTQAVATAPESHAIRGEARRKRAALLVAQFGGTALSEAGRRELRAAGSELLDVGDAEHAAEAFRLAGDTEGEAKALAQAGDVEMLESLLGEQQRKERLERQRTEVHREIDLLAESGRRREGVAVAERWLAAHDDAALRDRAETLKARRARGPIARVVIRGKTVRLALGDDVVIGRTEGTLLVASHAVSRQHLRIAREGDAVVVRDLATRNGTQLRGMSVAGAIAVPASGAAIELTLGKEVRVTLARLPPPASGVTVEVRGETYVAPLGPARIAGVPWELAMGADEWLELVTSGAAAYLGEVSLSERTTLLVGDVVTAERGGPEVLRMAAE